MAGGFVVPKYISKVSRSFSGSEQFQFNVEFIGIPEVPFSGPGLSGSFGF